jgi:N-methylhydantoinase A/oxoprolinase/acetone carboxylase beta subunit
MKLIGVDVGGTFTDLVVTDTEAKTIAIHKVATTTDDPSKGVVEGVIALCQRNGIDPASIDHILHGTTIATNAVLEHEGALTGMITTEGYRDIIHIGRHQRPLNYSIMQDIPWQAAPLIQRRHRKTVKERLVPPKGDVLTPLDEAGVRAAARALKAEGVEAIAVCFLFSYIDSRHEDRARAIILEEYPGVFVTTSARVAPQFREFERFTTAAMNAFIGPKVRRYVRRFEERLGSAGLKADLHIMASNGGAATAATVAELPVLTLLSGPAAGVLGGAWAAAPAKRERLITFDVGGTSADIGIALDGRFGEATARDTWIGGYPVLVPMIDIATIGAGGGSIAHVDAGGAFRVGPQSAGAQPGPACYARGGERPTVTDANLVLGRLDKDNFLGGEMALDETAAHRVIGQLAKSLKLDKMAAAEGVLTIVNANMANAIRAKTVQKGLDPRSFALVAFGGAGPLHGAEVAALLNIPEVIVPPFPGITSAAGLLTTDIKYDQIKTEFQVQHATDRARLETDFAALETQLRTQFKADGIAPRNVRIARFGDLRYVGQGYELRVAFPAGRLNEAALDKVWRAFHQQHQREYGHAFEASTIEIVNIRITGTGSLPKIGRPAVPAGRSLKEALVRRGRGAFRVNGMLGGYETAYYQRERLPLNVSFKGPAVVLQRDATTVVPPGWRAEADRGGNLILSRGKKD